LAFKEGVNFGHSHDDSPLERELVGVRVDVVEYLLQTLLVCFNEVIGSFKIIEDYFHMVLEASGLEVEYIHHFTDCLLDVEDHWVLLEPVGCNSSIVHHATDLMSELLC